MRHFREILPRFSRILLQNKNILPRNSQASPQGMKRAPHFPHHPAVFPSALPHSSANVPRAFLENIWKYRPNILIIIYMVSPDFPGLPYARSQ